MTAQTTCVRVTSHFGGTVEQIADLLTQCGISGVKTSRSKNWIDYIFTHEGENVKLHVASWDNRGRRDDACLVEVLHAAGFTPLADYFWRYFVRDVHWEPDDPADWPDFDAGEYVPCHRVFAPDPPIPTVLRGTRKQRVQT